MTKGILSWFIVDEEAKADADADAEAEARADAKAEAKARAPIVDQDRERLSKVIALIEALPAEASPEVKRAIVAASLEAFGVPIDRIIVTGEGALGVLDGHVAAGQQRTQEVLEQAEARIAKLTAEIAEVRRLMDVQVNAQQELARSTVTEKARIRVALDFFGSKKGLRLVG